MKNIICILLFTFLLLNSHFGLSQQFSPSPSNNKSQEILIRAKQRLVQNLKLSEMQADTVIAIQQRYMPNIEQIKSDKLLSQQDKEQKIKITKTEMMSEIKGVVGEQMAKKIEAYHHYPSEDALDID